MKHIILTDIEGTTSSISFVKDVMFPYAYKHLPVFVEARLNSPEIKEILNQVRSECKAPGLTPQGCVQALLGWIEDDKKITPLKTVQGMIWKEGFQKQEFTGHIYQDAYEILKLWRERGSPLYIYSSGSIAAQKLYFQYSDYGDLSSWFLGNFDTTIGGKLEVESYRRIAAALRVPTSNVLFLSDNLLELDAAQASGMATVWLNRDSSPTKTHHATAKDFYHVHKSQS